MVNKVTKEADRYGEEEGAPHLVVEIVSDRSVTKDTVRLLAAYWRSGILEYWLLDARGENLTFQIDHRGPAGHATAAMDAQGSNAPAFSIAASGLRAGGAVREGGHSIWNLQKLTPVFSPTVIMVEAGCKMSLTTPDLAQVIVSEKPET